MAQTFEEEMAVLWSENDVDQQLEAFERLKSSAKYEDLPKLVELLKSEKNNFWSRELLAEPISDLGGSEYLEELLEAFELNRLEGHDNDGFCHFLTEIAWAEPNACKVKLTKLLSKPNFEYQKTAKWLLAFCE